MTESQISYLRVTDGERVRKREREKREGEKKGDREERKRVRGERGRKKR